MGENGLTPVQRKMLEVLSDGERHDRLELHACLFDELGPVSNIHCHISRIRKRLPPGEAIVCELFNRRIYYRHIRLLAPQPKG